MAHKFTQSDLEAYLDEALPVAAMAKIENALRDDRKLAEELVAINGRRDAGLHSVGEIWRRHRLSCPTREQLGSYLLNVLDADVAGHIRFHLDVSGCRTCQANFDDLKTRQTDEPAAVDSRRKKYFQSSAGQLRRVK
jgi:hypothetical protein